MQCTQSIFGNLPANNLKHYVNLNIAMLLLLLPLRPLFKFDFLSTLKYSFQSINCICTLCSIEYIVDHDLLVNLYNLLQLIEPTTACYTFFLTFNLHSRQVNLREQIANEKKQKEIKNTRISTRAKLLT